MAPQFGGKWHHDETVIRCDGQNEWFWEMIDEDTRFLVASHPSGDRTQKDCIEVFQKALDQAKQKPRAMFVDSSYYYVRAFNRVFYSRYKASQVELVQRVGIRARETNNIVERLHEALKEMTRPMRGFKNEDSARIILEGYTVNYNFARPHLSLKGKTPAEEAGIQVKGWKQLIENAIQTKTMEKANPEAVAVAPVQVVREKRALVALPDEIWDIINHDLKGKVGTGHSDSIRTIVLLWLGEQGYLKKGGENAEEK